MTDQHMKPSRFSGQPHNDFFNANFKTVKRARPLLESALKPALRKIIDWDTLTVESSNLTNPQNLRAQYADLVLKARLKKYPEVWIGFIVEHKSSPDPGVMVQLMGYETDLYRQRFYQVFSIIVYHGLKGWYKEKTFQAFNRAGLPDKLLNQLKQGRMDFEAIFMWLKDPSVQERVSQMPMDVQLLLHAMLNIWESSVADLKDWFKWFQPLPDDEVLELSRSVFEYFLQVRERAYNIEELKVEFEAMEPGDEYMKMIQDRWLEWLPMTIGDIRDQSIEEGLERGREEGGQQMAIEMARRCIEDGMSDDKIQTYTRLSPDQIRGLKNGRDDSGD